MWPRYILVITDILSKKFTYFHFYFNFNFDFDDFDFDFSDFQTSTFLTIRHFRLPTFDFRLSTPEFRVPSSDFRLPLKLPL